MAIPDFQTLMLPLLALAASGKQTVPECVPEIAKQFALSEDELAEMLPSRRQLTVVNRLHWARTYLAKAGLLRMVKRGVFEASTDGARVLAEKPDRIDMRYLERFEAYRRWRAAGSKEDKTGPDAPQLELAPSSTETPQERIEAAHNEINAILADELLDRLMTGSPAFFEGAVLDLLLAMGYGRGRKGADQLTGKPGDGGIDGIINEDALGLDAVYVQAKRYAPERAIGRPDIQQFVGSLTGEGAAKGVFVTMSCFTKDAERYVDRIAQRIVLIDGQRFAQLMIANGVGVRATHTITLLEIDENFFSED